ncbi:tRNA uridine-5-carboxymethylaminomethyl(34) synthesis GTPase MnmE [Rhodopseudomonas sp. BR0G17]|uniref:tRNA uridine-5-carboxymethylaminomethyl(34) synthesis GTPase MnmE n=1 Tax=Rhodopseudomonas sp. BR0G17 TaxID=2269368 RepID=UPI0013E056E4|nr:tRNA uridine-5-carboxymethylaminomethyl(34) synthesis GTPase MnmE [Rhodopseudomonas sp. BR0G17]NEW97611.1 tRNA uridine-5-carboxymethylaminomethyl(34) synthesis GTPase MnmE [Rhodopseudomonas sp. BR0G17]
MHPSDQTIFALATGPLPAAIAIVRVSGSRAGDVLTALTGSLPSPRRAVRCDLRTRDGELIDDGVAVWFPAPASATGEDVAELHIHGSRAVAAALIKTLSAFDGVRPAEPGEFTRRGFENGKLDLTEAEGLDDLIHADTDAQRRQALRQLGGVLGDRARRWRDQIIEALALVEAGIDFSDEGDVADELMGPARARIAELSAEIAEVLAEQGRGEKLRDGMVVAIAGPPNVGKSTLINRLARREVAIVSPHAGTTRDVIEVQLDLDGYPVTVIDTAGLRDSDDPVEQEGVRRARARAASADLVLWLSTATDASDPDVSGPEVWRVRNKIDLTVGEAEAGPSQPAFRISAATGEGFSELLRQLTRFAAQYFGSAEAGLITRDRHRLLLAEASASLERSLVSGLAEEIVAEELRSSAHSLGRLLGRVDVEDVLGEIFSRFCIGK